MRVRFTAVQLVGGNRHEHISRLRATNVVTGENYDDTRANWVTYMERDNSGFVHDRYGHEIDVYVNSNGRIKWIQTYADGVWTDNLLALPRF